MFLHMSKKGRTKECYKTCKKALPLGVLYNMSKKPYILYEIRPAKYFT